MTKTTFRLKPSLAIIASAALFAGLAVPAHATNTSTSSRSSDVTAPAEASDGGQARERQICVRADFTGSRLPRTVCKTQREWEAEGGVPTAE